jgi:transcriptional regulator with XRE-family HTH domain
MECPLPINWLDWLEDPSDPLLAEHLERCPSCQTLVALLRRDHLDLSGPQPPTVSGVTFEESAGAAPDAGELWVTTPADIGGDRALVLVLDDLHEEFDRVWYEVAAADTTIERATELDLVLQPAETNVRSPLRLRFDVQGYVAEADLLQRAGALTEAGRTVVDAALHGSVDESRWGLPIEGPYDERLIQPDHNAAVVQQLQILYRVRAAAADDAELTLASVLREVRTQRGLSRVQFTDTLAERLGLAPLTGKIKRYYADLENGVLSPSALRPALIINFARILGLPRQQLEGLKDAWTPPPPAVGTTVFARSAGDVKWRSAEATAEPQRWDAVDELFLGGDDA